MLIDNWISTIGVLLELNSDQGRNFKSNLFQRITEVLGIRKTRTMPLQPMSAGRVERFNCIIEEHFSNVVAEYQKYWHLLLFLLAYRSRVRLPCVIDYVDDLKEKLLSFHGTMLHKGNSIGFRAGEEGKVVSRSCHQTGKVHILSWPRSTMSFTWFEKDENEECSLKLMNTTVTPLTFLIATIRTKEGTVLRNKPTRRSVTTRMGFLEGCLVRWFIIGDGGARIKKSQKAEVVVILQKNLDRETSR